MLKSISFCIFNLNTHYKKYVMNECYWNEIWKAVIFDDGISDTEKYEISNYGRAKRFTVDPAGEIINLSRVQGYPRIVVLQKSGKATARYIHKLMGDLFLEKTSEDQKFVIHLDYIRDNNFHTNLRWANKTEKDTHRYENPEYDATEHNMHNARLTENQVRLIKIKIAKGKTKLKILAKQFGVSDMQISRIKSGENWGHIKI